MDITVTVKSIEAPRTFDKFGKQISVANAIVVDESGEVKMTLWNDDIEKVKAGDMVKITNGYVNEFKGELQLTTGKFGKLEVLDKDNLPDEEDLSDEEGMDY